jgi:hypothetical protein
MQELRLVAVSEDGRSLVLREPSGQEYALPLDDALRAAVRYDHARLGQLQIELESQLRPREIQARIRAGETAEEVAAAAGIPVEKVRRYEGPVLAERAHIANQARTATVRRSGTAEGPAPRLGELVASRLEPGGIDVELLGWDAWRRDDGRWLVRLAYPLGNRQRAALWLYDPPRRVVLPEDDEAQAFIDGRRPGESAQRRQLSGREGGERAGAARGSGADGAPARRLTSVPGGAADVRPVPPEHAPSGRDETGSQEPGEPAGPGETADDDVAAAPGGTPRDPAGEAGEAGSGEAPAASPSGTSAGSPEAPGERSESSPRHAAEPQRRKAARSGRRASVPSWDDIVFGTRKSD